MKATLSNHHQTPRKVRLVANTIRGKSVSVAKHTLTFLNKKASEPIEKLLDSAVSNAVVMGASAKNLVIKTITVDKGTVMKRARPFARGRSGTVRKIMSHITIELVEVPEVNDAQPVKAKQIAKKAAKKTSKKTEKAAK